MFLSEVGLQRVSNGRGAPAQSLASSLLATAAAPSGTVWSVSASEDDELPRAFTTTKNGHQLIVGLPSAAYAALAVRADDDAWFAGGLLSATSYGEPVRVGGEGTLVHFDGRAFARFRGPDGAFLAVASPAAGEAWAVGLRGSILHVKDGRGEPFYLDGEPVLRAVAAPAANDVWLAGDDATLLHGDGATFHRVDTSALGSRAAIAAMIAPGKSPGWVVSPSGIFKIVPAH
jgi:hypothetical protein